MTALARLCQRSPGSGHYSVLEGYDGKLSRVFLNQILLLLISSCGGVVVVVEVVTSRFSSY